MALELTRAQIRLALRNAAAVADMVAWLGADYCLAKRNTAHATD